jgi:1-deoxy-D-xylulose-5-phosphate reductoisomerase
VAVDAFLNGRLPFTGIVSTVASVLETHITGTSDEPGVSLTATGVTLEVVLAADAWARTAARELLTGGM